MGSGTTGTEGAHATPPKANDTNCPLSEPHIAKFYGAMFKLQAALPLACTHCSVGPCMPLSKQTWL